MTIYQSILIGNEMTWSFAMHHLPDKARANHLNPGLVTHAGLIHGRHASQCMGLVATSPVISQAVKNIAQKSNKPASETLACTSQRLCLSDRYIKMHVHRTRFVLDRFNTSCRCETSHNKLHNWHADSSCGSVVHLSRERIAPRDLEPNLSQMLHLV